MKTLYLLIGVMFISADCQPQITTSPEYLCLGDLVQLTCSAQGSARWRSDDILGHNQFISFTTTSQIDSPPITVGNGTGVLIEKGPHFVISLSFNLTTDRVETSCTNSQRMTTTTISSVQPSPKGDYPVRESGESITWNPPSNIGDFLLQSYQLTIECNGRVVDGVNTTETTYSYDEGKLIPGLCNVTVRVVNSCGDTASNSTLFSFEGPTEVPTEDESNIGLGIGLGVGISVLGIIVYLMVQVVTGLLYNKGKMDEENQALKKDKAKLERKIFQSKNKKKAKHPKLSRSVDKKGKKIRKNSEDIVEGTDSNHKDLGETQN